MFAALVTFQINPGVDDLTDCVFVAWRGFEPERYYEKFGRYLEPGTNMTPFDGALVNSICRGGLTVLSNRSGPICFSRLLIGSTPFGWDMDLKPDQGMIARPRPAVRQRLVCRGAHVPAAGLLLMSQRRS